MKCQVCSNPATVHVTRIIHKQKQETHLCELCAEKLNLFPAESKEELNIPSLLQLLMSQPFFSVKEDATHLVCPDCGMKYTQFRSKGRLGCPTDYEVFHAVLEPLLERIHRKTKHVGKIPGKLRKARLEVERLELQRQLKDAVAAERFEEAARLRDLIRAREFANDSR